MFDDDPEGFSDEEAPISAAEQATQVQGVLQEAQGLLTGIKRDRPLDADMDRHDPALPALEAAYAEVDALIREVARVQRAFLDVCAVRPPDPEIE